jgi:two-component system cell cycle response regulator
VLQRSVRAGDLVARYGGEEFCIVMRDTSLETAVQIAERVRLAVGAEALNTYDGRPFSIQASIGVVDFAGDGGELVDLYQRASDKVQEAKNKGRNQVRS